MQFTLVKKACQMRSTFSCTKAVLLIAIIVACFVASLQGSVILQVSANVGNTITKRSWSHPFFLSVRKWGEMGNTSQETTIARPRR